jgi:putative ABC transport system permease protein
MVAVLTLALGIGANAAIFTVIRAVLLKSPPYADADRLVLLGEKRPDASNYSGAISAPNYLDWVHQNTVFEQMAAVTGGGVTLSGGSTEPVYVDGRTVSASYFDVFGIRAAVGRTFRTRRGSTRQGTRGHSQSPAVGLAVRLGLGRDRQTGSP